MKVLVRVFIAALILSIPVVSILAAENLICRAPDLYTYEFTRSQILNEINTGISDKEMGEFFSDFMLGKESEFSLIDETADRPGELFNSSEADVMDKVRYIMNYLTYILVFAFLLLIIALWILMNRRLKQEVRKAFKWCWLNYIVIWLFFASALYFHKIRAMVFSWISIERFGDESLLLQLINAQFIRDWFFTGFGISFIFMAIIGSVIWRITKPRRIFW